MTLLSPLGALSPLVLLAASPAEPPLGALRYVDVDGNAFVDRVECALDGTLTVSLGRGARRFERVAQELPRVELRALVAGDLDGDGDTDLYLVTPGANVALAGDGTGRFTDATRALGLEDEGAGVSVELRDLDGDGRDDLLLANAASDVLFWGTGSGFERDGSSVPASQASFALTPEEKRILGLLSLERLPDGQGGTTPTLRISGVNVQIVNGLGATNGNPAAPDSPDWPRSPVGSPTAVNGAGNLIVGYNELGGASGDDRTGSHNLVVGVNASYTSFGGVVFGQDNASSAPFAAALGGAGNHATRIGATVSGGEANTASGYYSSVTGGELNLASGRNAAVTGGSQNLASGASSATTGGSNNRAGHPLSSISGGVEGYAGPAASVSGGHANTASFFFSSVSGGVGNFAIGYGASITGGRGGNATGAYATITGGDAGRAPGSASSVGGGHANTASGNYATVSGGKLRTATGDYSWAAGALAEPD